MSAVDAMGISTTLPVALIALSVAALFGLAVAAGVLAARGVLENIAAARYVEETLIEGQRVRFRGEKRRSRRSGYWPRSCALSRAQGSPSPTRCCNEKQYEGKAGRRPGEREDTVEEVINEFRDTVGPYLPRVAGALAIIIVGWLLAHVASRLVRSGVRRARLDGALCRSAGR